MPHPDVIFGPRGQAALRQNLLYRHSLLAEAHLKTRILLLSLVIGTSSASASSFKKLLIFGDSISDIYAGSELSRARGLSPLPPANLYFDHHWSNGPIWSDYVASHFLLQQSNYAVGGATLGVENSLQILGHNLGGIKQEISRFAHNQKISRKTLTILEGGYNNIILEVLRNITLPANLVDTMIGQTQERIKELLELEARPLIVWNLFDATVAPIFSTPPLSSLQHSVRQVISDYNSRLSVLIKKYNMQNRKEIIFIFDAYTAFNKTLDGLQQEGINLSSYTLTLVPSVPLGFVLTGPLDFRTAWYDTVHPGTYFWKKFSPFLNNFIEQLELKDFQISKVAY